MNCRGTEAPPTFSNRAVRLAALFQIALMIFFRAPEFRRRFNLSHDWAIEFAACRELLLERFRRGFLLRRMVKNDRAILRSNVRTLAIQGHRIVARPENIEELIVIDLGGVELHLDDLGVPGLIAANIFVSRIVLFAAGVTHGRW